MAILGLGQIHVYVKFPGGGGGYPFVLILYLLSAVCITHKTLITTVNICHSEEPLFYFAKNRVHWW